MSAPTTWHISLTSEGQRSLDQLGEKFATAVVEFILRAVTENPRRVGRPLGHDLTGKHSARRGVYRVIYTIDDESRTVFVSRIDHRSDVYRPQ